MIKLIRAWVLWTVPGLLIGCTSFSFNRSQYVRLNDGDAEFICLKLHPTRGSGSRDTEIFERIGCCYNDGLKEPAGC